MAHFDQLRAGWINILSWEDKIFSQVLLCLDQWEAERRICGQLIYSSQTWPWVNPHISQHLQLWTFATSLAKVILEVLVSLLSFLFLCFSRHRPGHGWIDISQQTYTAVYTCYNFAVWLFRNHFQPLSQTCAWVKRHLSTLAAVYIHYETCMLVLQKWF